ncbi:cysteinyl-tRNA synthetase [Defluviimonas sp. 20V17]|uniref:Cysteine--tRNA ligase n=1 Tax=Allgaiera indica TaxID=765699 RepID=A0AAN4ZYA4_9RHOB|nr:cysteine--tRNA ligase [Allgaiera indica]KDB03733.1 cysteinyl-tRNA synthetase [Defluviimonas sp. 20V17]GHD99802.1 cysteine--tRNA ligase [Allgaiera indica]SDW43513.1 cysteinyl-tRNA synthetase [Allgaiera indica]
MVEIRLHNTKTRRKERFDPIDPDNVRIYVCGPTVYDRAHLGNARPVVVFDTLFRLMRHVYGADHVTYVRNFTDVDDKINARAATLAEGGDARSLEEIIRALTDETIGWYHADMDALGALRPTQEPRATHYIDDMKDMISTLIDKGFAYVVRDQSNNPPEEFVLADREALLSSHALFEVQKFERYGQLSGRWLDDMIAGARVEVAPYKRNPMDFVLWKPSTDDLPGWGSPWGRGRPGWHIECSAMSKALLGDVFDIHGGGIDLQFPHHENEIAQSCCANGTEEMARYWMHNEMLQVEGKKMSKSLGNFFTVRDLLEQGVPGEVIRFVMLSTHYSKPMDWTAEKAAQAKATLAKWYRATNGIEAAQSVPDAVVQALADDLNGHMAIVHLYDLLNRDMLSELKAAISFLGFGEAEEIKWWRMDPLVTGYGVSPGQIAEIPPVLDQIVRRIQALRDERRYDEADAMRSALRDAGVEVRITKSGPETMLLPDFDPAKLDALE